MFFYFKELFLRLPRKIQLRLIALQMLIICGAILEVLGVGSAIPFISVITDPKALLKNDLSKSILNYFGAVTNEDIIFCVGVILVCLFILINITRIIILYCSMKMNVQINTFLASSLFRYYIHQDYLFHTKNNSATLREKVFSETGRVGGAIKSFLSITNYGLTCLFISIFLLVKSPITSLLIGIVLVITYLIVYFFIKGKIRRYGEQVSRAYYSNSRAINESFNAIKDVKLFSLEDKYVTQIEKGVYDQRFANAASKLWGTLPRYFLEVVVIFLMVGIVFFFIETGRDINALLPTLTLYAFAAHRLMPALQAVFAASTSIKHQQAAFENIWDDYCKALSFVNYSGNIRKTISFEKKILIRSLHFSYNNHDKVIENLNLEIHKNQTIGFVGVSGSGKSTIVDLILGFIEPQKGKIVIDGNILNRSEIHYWQQNIGYVPQHIFISDCTIAENIAFGENINNIDFKRMKLAAETAGLHTFIETLPNSYNSVVGEHGAQLSGGQRQRIGIARALYRNPEIIVFDEATSALDGITESAVIEAVHKIGHKKTIIMIAHRLTTVKDCDEIFFFEAGKIVDKGTFEDLLKRNNSFRKMSKIN